MTGTADLTPERERYAEALAVERMHGETAFVFIAERIGSAVKAGDEAAVRRWREVADRLDRLQRRGMLS